MAAAAATLRLLPSDTWCNLTVRPKTGVSQGQTTTLQLVGMNSPIIETICFKLQWWCWRVGLWGGGGGSAQEKPITELTGIKNTYSIKVQLLSCGGLQYT